MKTILDVQKSIQLQNNRRYGFQHVSRMERAVLVKECYTTRADYLAQPIEERMKYVYWLEAQQSSPIF